MKTAEHKMNVTRKRMYGEEDGRYIKMNRKNT